MADSFPKNYFFIRNVASGRVLDVEDGSRSPGASIIIWYRKGSEYDNQLWKYEDGFLVNKQSGLVMEVQGYNGGKIEPGTELVQARRRNSSQRWVYNCDCLMPLEPKVCVWGKGGNVYVPGTTAIVDTRIPDEFTQEWMLDSL